MKFADADIAATRIFALDQLEDCRIVEPGLDVTARAIGPDEGHDFQLGPLCLGQFKRALVRPAVRDDADDAIAAKNLAHLIERVEGRRLLIVVQVSVEYVDPLLRTSRRKTHRRSSECGEQNPANSHSGPLEATSTLTHR